MLQQYCIQIALNCNLHGICNVSAVHVRIWNNLFGKKTPTDVKTEPPSFACHVNKHASYNSETTATDVKTEPPSFACHAKKHTSQNSETTATDVKTEPPSFAYLVPCQETHLIQQRDDCSGKNCEFFREVDTRLCKLPMIDRSRVF